MEDKWPDGPKEQRLRQLLCSSAFTPKERNNIKRWLSTQPTPHRINEGIAWALKRIQDHDKTQAPIGNLLASLGEKISYRLDKLEKFPDQPILPILPPSQRGEAYELRNRGKRPTSGVPEKHTAPPYAPPTHTKNAHGASP